MSANPINVQAEPLPLNLKVQVNVEFLVKLASAIVLLQNAVVNLESIMVAKGLAERDG